MALNDLFIKTFGKWKKDGRNRVTGTFYDSDGYDRTGYSREGFNAAGYNKDGYDKDGFRIDGYDREEYNEKGFNRVGYNREGLDEQGFNRDGIHKETGEPYDTHGFNREGLNLYGFDRNGIHTVTKKDHDPYGFDRFGIHEKTGKYHDSYGFAIHGINKETEKNLDKHGFNRDGKHGKTGEDVDEYGFNRDGIHKETRREYDSEGFNIDGIHEVTGKEYDKHGFNRNAIHGETLEFTDPFGFDKLGINRKTGNSYDDKGFDIDGYNQYGFNRQGFHRITGIKRDKAGFDIDGIHKQTNDRYDENLFNRDGNHKITGVKYNKYHFNAEGLHKDTKDIYNKDGFDIRGFHRDTQEPYDKSGFDIDGNHHLTKKAWDEQGFDKNGYTAGGFNRKGIHRDTGKLYDKNGFDIDGNRREASKEELARYLENRERRKKTQAESLLFTVSPEKFNEKVQNYTRFFAPEEIKNAKSYVKNKQGIPVGSSGNNAVVYCFENSHKFAVRCFYRLYPSQKTKYGKLREFIKKNALEFLLDFDYYEKGVLIDGKWLPITVLPWSDGQPITNYLERVSHDAVKVERLTDEFLSMIGAMHAKRVAHGDLQHGNILVDSFEKIKLIDYDNFYLEELIENTSPEIGHRNYQHPKRDCFDYDRYMDNFSEWTILISLKALAKKPELRKWLKDDDERLLFTGEDYREIEKSAMYKELLSIKDENLTSLVKNFAEITKLQNLYEIPSVLYYADSVTQAVEMKSSNKERTVQEMVSEKPLESVQKPAAPNNMVEVKGGSFQMGNVNNDKEGASNEKPVHTVTLTYDYWMGKYEITNAEYRSFLNGRGVRSDGRYNGKELIDMGRWGYSFEYRNGGFVLNSGKGERNPIPDITWWGAIEYCNWLSEKEGIAKAYDSNGNPLDGNGNITTDITKVQGYRLPTEAEWEYAARGGQNAKGYEYAGSDDLNEVGWYWNNSRKSTTHQVGEKKPNELGLYDMSGNVYEWCYDRYNRNYYEKSDQMNPIGPGGSRTKRVYRGGSWGSFAWNCRVASRGSGTPESNYGFLGFRLVRTVIPTTTIATTNTKVISIKVQSDPAEGGEARVNNGTWGTIQNIAILANSRVTLEAIEKDGFIFKGWYNDQTRLSGDRVYSFNATIPGNNYISKFEKQSALLKMVKVKGGTFQMGPAHTVKLTYDYWLGECEVTFDEYDTFCEATGRSKPDEERWGRGTRPVINVSWWDAIGYCNWLSEKEGIAKAYDSDWNLLDGNGNITTGIKQVKGYRLPTEAEWEYAARGGQNTKGYEFSGSDNLNEVGWYWNNSGGKTHPVGEKDPNELGLYDMSGNVLEWCHDYWYGGYASTTQTNPTGPTSGSDRVLRGGGWSSFEQHCRVAHRNSIRQTTSGYFLGFRLSRTVF